MSNKELKSFYNVYSEYLKKKMKMVEIMEAQGCRNLILDTTTKPLDTDNIDAQNVYDRYEPFRDA